MQGTWLLSSLGSLDGLGVSEQEGPWSLFRTVGSHLLSYLYMASCQGWFCVCPHNLLILYHLLLGVDVPLPSSFFEHTLKCPLGHL